MPRDLPVGNGDLLITFDRQYRLRDIYYPNVGRFDHTGGHIQRFGVWADGKFAWVEDPEWRREMRYKPETLVTDVRLVHEGLALEVRCEDAVDASEPVYFRRTTVRDLLGRARDVRLFFHFDPSISGTPVGDTANYDPATSSVVMYKDDIYFLITAADEHKTGIDHWAIGTKRLGGAEGTWRDAEDGELGRNAISQGSVDATIGFNLALEPGGERTVTAWLVCGRSYQDVKACNRRIVEAGPQRMLARTEAYWRLWARSGLDLSPLPARVRELFSRSLLIVRTQVDNGGAILAANDSDVTAFGGDHYSYCWMRDAALVAYSLILTGHGEPSRRFFRFAARVIEKDGYFLHKYSPTGQLASSWHPWMLGGQRVLPIQQDQTSLVIWALRKHFEAFGDAEFIKTVYEPLVVRPADWLLEYRDLSGLPLPSWDLWEERRGVHTFTVAATIGALRAAAQFAKDFGEMDRAAKYAEEAERMRGALRRVFWDGERGRVARMGLPMSDVGCRMSDVQNGGAGGTSDIRHPTSDIGRYELDFTADSANYALFAFGAFEARDPMVEAEMRALRERLWVKTEVGGCARYERDYFHQVEREKTDAVPGNPWVICTLWHAQHAIARATNLGELREAIPYLEWACDRAFDSGVLAEQFHPYTGAPIGVSPLTWSHATVVTVVVEYLRKLQQLTRGSVRGPRANVETEMSVLP
ncbi:MAG: glycoside hydrolase family 15 protein [Phycisphaerales bacterium]